MSQFCGTCGDPRVVDIGEATVSVPMTARDLLELLWNIALAADNPAPDPEGDVTQRLVARLELALSLVSDAQPPSEEIAEQGEMTRG
jgi:hypothetical protein